MGGLQALLCSGEQAGRAALTLASERDDWAAAAPRREDAARSAAAPRVAEILHGPDCSTVYPSLRPPAADDRGTAADVTRFQLEQQGPGRAGDLASADDLSSLQQMAQSDGQGVL